MPEKETELKKCLRPANVFAIAIGSIIGFACFVLPGDWINEAGPIGVSIAFALGAIAIVFIGKGYGYMIEKYPVAGGAFAFAYKGFGKNHAYVCGWLLTLGYISIVALNASALPILARFIVPGIFAKGYLYSIAGWDIYLGEILISVTAILLFGYLNYQGSEIVGRIQFFMVVLLFGSVLLLTIGSLMNPGSTVDNLRPLFAPGKTPVAAVLTILAIAPMAFVGFDTIPHAAEEFDFSPRMAFTLIIVAVLSGGGMYILVTLATAVVFPWQDLIASRPVWATGVAMNASMGLLGTIILVTGVVMAIGTGLNGFYLAASRLMLSMARAKLLPRWFGEINPRYNTPSNAVIFILIICLFPPWFGRNAILCIVDMCSVGTAVSFFYTSFTAFMLSRKNDTEKTASPVYLIAAIFSVVFLVLLTVPGMPAFMAKESWVAFVIWVTVGVGFYFAQANEYKAIPAEQLDYLILGKNV